MLNEMNDKPTKTVIVVGRKFVITFTTIAVILFALVGFSIQYTGYVDRKRDETEERRNQQLCDLFGSIDKQYQDNPPTTEAARQFAQDIHELVESLNCPQ
jgi:hypothetical protein